MVDPARCELCGQPSAGSFRADFGHLRAAHPRYARGLVLRMVAPLLFLAVMGALVAASAPTWAYFSALAIGVLSLVVGKVESRRAREQANVRSAPPIRQIMRDGGFRFVLLPVLLAALVFLSLH